MLCVSLVLVLIAGCFRQTVLIDVQPGFSGQVTIQCHPWKTHQEWSPLTGQAQETLTICTNDSLDLDVPRGRAAATILGPITWVRTGDGVPLRVSFAVK